MFLQYSKLYRFPREIADDIISLSTDEHVDGDNDIVCRMRTFDEDSSTLYKDIYLPNDLGNKNVKGNQKRISLNSRV